MYRANCVEIDEVADARGELGVGGARDEPAELDDALLFGVRQIGLRIVRLVVSSPSRCRGR